MKKEAIQQIENLLQDIKSGNETDPLIENRNSSEFGFELITDILNKTIDYIKKTKLFLIKGFWSKVAKTLRKIAEIIEIWIEE